MLDQYLPIGDQAGGLPAPIVESLPGDWIDLPDILVVVEPVFLWRSEVEVRRVIEHIVLTEKNDIAGRLLESGEDLLEHGEVPTIEIQMDIFTESDRLERRAHDPVVRDAFEDLLLDGRHDLRIEPVVRVVDDPLGEIPIRNRSEFLEQPGHIPAVLDPRPQTVPEEAPGVLPGLFNGILGIVVGEPEIASLSAK